MWNLLKKCDSCLKNNIYPLVLLFILTILRIPNFFEPYWYGDEAIYLTIGTGLRNGLRLYSEIIDHKTPLIYYLAMTPNQFSFRLLNYFWTVAIIIIFYKLAKTLLKSNIQSFIASLFLLIVMTLPWFEGNIPNGEIFVMGFVLVGSYIISKTEFFKSFFQEKYKVKEINQKKEVTLLLSSGVFFGLGILTKVPALLDLAAFMSIGWFSIFAKFRNNKKFWKKELVLIVRNTVLILIGAFIPIILSILYFIAIGSGKDYFDFGLLYNFRYSGSWKLTFENHFLESLFTLQAKTLLLAATIVLLTILKKYLKPAFQFAATWFALTLFASLLSNRPYPHYFIQLMPALSIMLVHTLNNFAKLKCLSKDKLKKYLKSFAPEIIFTSFLLYLFVSILSLLNVGFYPTKKYYQNFYRLITNKISIDEYNQSFNHLIKDNYKIAELVKDLQIKRMFIWGTNPILYAQTKTIPTSRFTVSFHIKDFEAYDETFDLIIKHQPKLIIVMNDEHQPFPDLEQYLEDNYLPNYQYDHMVLYLKKS